MPDEVPDPLPEQLPVDTAPSILSASLVDDLSEGELLKNRHILGPALMERLKAVLLGTFAPEAAEWLASKMTGMLLCRDTDDVLGMLSRADDLLAHGRDALQVLASKYYLYKWTH
jgi:hypothetical protein